MPVSMLYKSLGGIDNPVQSWFSFSSKNKTDYKELLQDLKKDKRRPIIAEETAEIQSRIEKIKRAKLDVHLQNDELER